MSKRKKVVLALLGALAVLQTGTHLLFAHSAVPAIAPRLTPEHTHFAEGTTFSWVYLRVADCENLSERQKAGLLSRLGRRYDKVYEAEADISEHLIHRDAKGEWTGYEGGFSYRFSVVSSGPFWVKVKHGDLVGDVAASSGEHVYVWVLGVWVKLYDGPMAVA
jgi:hypothetical protein